MVARVMGRGYAEERHVIGVSKRFPFLERLGIILFIFQAVENAENGDRQRANSDPFPSTPSVLLSTVSFILTLLSLTFLPAAHPPFSDLV